MAVASKTASNSPKGAKSKAAKKSKGAALPKKLQGHDPRHVFYMAVFPENRDGSLALDTLCADSASQDIQAVIDEAKDRVIDNGGMDIIYECIPIMVVRRPEVSVDHIDQLLELPSEDL